MRNFKLRLIVAQGKKTFGASPDDINRILKSPQFIATPPKVIPGKRNISVSKSTDTKEVTARDVQNMSAVGMDIVSKLMNTIRERSQGLTFKVTPANQPLWVAGKAIFGPQWDGNITFAMFEYLLKINRQFMTALKGNG